MKEGFVGLGAMGKPIAMNLLKAGADLAVCVRSPDRAEDLAEAGAQVTTDLRMLGECDIVYLCLPDGVVVTEVLLGGNGLAKALGTGSIVADLSTHDGATAVSLSEQLTERGICYLDAPISGMEARAREGTLTVMCGGAETQFAKLYPRFATFASRILHMGPVGAGQGAKLINQLLFNVNMAALAELAPVAVDLGLKPERVADVINGGTGRSHASEFFLPRILKGQFEEGYPLEKAYKDMQAGVSLSAARILPVPLLSAAMATYQMALRRGFGAQGKGAMTRVFEELVGAEFRRSDDGDRHGTERLRIFSTLALQGLVSEMIGDGALGAPESFDVVFGPTRLLQTRIREGDLPDLALLTDEAARALEAEGLLKARKPLAISSLGLVLAPGVPGPDLADRAALAEFLQAVPSIVYSASGASGIFFASLLEEMGLARTMADKATVIPSGLTAERVATGEAASAVQQISELLAVEGVGRPVPFPDDAQCRAVFSLAVFRNSDKFGSRIDELSRADDRLIKWGLSPVAADPAQ